MLSRRPPVILATERHTMSSAHPAPASVLASALGRRRFLSLAAIGGATAALAACSGPSTAGGGAQAAADVDFAGIEPATSIDFWSNHPGQAQPIEKELIAKFEEATGIKVNLVTAGSNYEEIAQKFQSTLTAQSGLPGVVVLSDVWWFRYYMDKTITPLDSLISQLEWDTSDYQESLVADYQYDGAQWAMPYGRSTPLFYYNKDQFAAAGLPDRAPETWDEFAEWAPKLMDSGKDKSGYLHAFMYPDVAGYAGWSMQNMLWGNGAAWSNEWDITCDSDEAVATFQWMQDSVYQDKWAGVSSSDAAADFSSGAVSATILSTGSLIGVLENAQFDVGVGFLPAGDVDGPVCPTGGAGLGIPAGIPDEEKLAAAMFIKFIGEPENTAAFSEATGYMPVRKSADMTAALEATPQLQVAMDQLAATRVQDYARVFLPGADQEMAKAALAVLTQEADPQTSLTTLRETLEGIYENDVAPKLDA
ncbi:carbohydrate ABC transporter substrate-binding protein (CUT1 family) [Zhihengliuella halotolerans]|uniref:Carbohydrate ABC transporter substrate-binding protein (CUT1 family) n=2 Tax=Zhihengliuella halotolerans TaxID=370736 RepID=A0A4Q8A9N0_9MICC|nr:carbohydrate ABC transporter substrate-binding protein (CUT1 family) [Zhihengliuella halotolerans]